jgi:hypothetical protein
MQQSATEFTVDQLKYLEWVATPKAAREQKTLTAFAKKIGVDRTTLWRWSSVPQFREAVLQAARSYLKDELPEIYGALADRAKGGDVPAIKLALEVSGEYTPRQDLTSGGEKIAAPVVYLPAVDDSGD